MCRSRRELSNAYLLAKIGVDTAENEPLEVWAENSIHYSLHSLVGPRLLLELRLILARLRVLPSLLVEPRRRRVGDVRDREVRVHRVDAEPVRGRAQGLCFSIFSNCWLFFGKL